MAAQPCLWDVNPSAFSPRKVSVLALCLLSGGLDYWPADTRKYCCLNALSVISFGAFDDVNVSRPLEVS